MELLTGFPLLLQQFKALFLKNLLLSMRNKRSIILRILSPIFFLSVLVLAQKNLDSQYKNDPLTKDVRDPETIIITSIPACEDKFFIKLPCFDFVWSGNESAKVQSIVSKIMENNPGRPIPSSRVKSFRTPKEVDEWLLSDPMRSAAALHLVERDDNVISYGIQTNKTDRKKQGKEEDQVFKFQIPLQVAAEREIARFFLGDPKFEWLVELSGYPHPPSSEEEPTNAALDMLGTTLFLAIAMFGFIFQISALVVEKELKLRQAMSVMGLYDTAYWISWMTWEGIILSLSSLVVVVFGWVIRFDFFTRNNFALLFLVFYLFQFSMMGIAFLLSALLTKSSSATTIGFAFFLVFTATSNIAKLIGYASIPKKYRLLYAAFPPHLFAEAVQMLTQASNEPKGLSWSDRTKCLGEEDPSAPCLITINKIFIWQLLAFHFWFLLAIYLDNIIPNPAGVRKPFYYFVTPQYWFGNEGKKMEEGCLSLSNPAPDHITSDDVDVREEEATVKEQAKEGAVDPGVAVQIRGLIKTYPATIELSCQKCCFCCCCCKIQKTKAYQAVKGLWMNFAKDQLFCLLGPNGAGKTTAISCLTGITPISLGDALIYGYSVRSSSGMSNIRKIIGVCPQFDILWDTLSGEEHLRIFASIKGLDPSLIDSVAEKLLAEVRLSDKAKVRSVSYSGGMKRRLSVAVALIGDPKLVILDEPTTGMDPITRRHVWDVIEAAKKGRSILLTTHSMEEADILSDRIAVMAKGRLRCIGTSIRLKSRFGSGFLASLRFSEDSNEENQKSVKKFFKQRLNVTAKDETKYALNFVIPQEKEDMLTDFFDELQSQERLFGIVDIQLSLTTLEEVFLNIAKQAELENAIAEGNVVTLMLQSGTELSIPVGAKYVGIPGSESSENPYGVMVEVSWGQNENGAIIISGHSAEMSVPHDAKVKTSVPTPTTLGGEGMVNGIIYDID